MHVVDNRFAQLINRMTQQIIGKANQKCHRMQNEVPYSAVLLMFVLCCSVLCSVFQCVIAQLSTSIVQHVLFNIQLMALIGS